MNRLLVQMRLTIAGAYALGAVANQFLPLLGVLGGALVFVLLTAWLERSDERPQ